MVWSVPLMVVLFLGGVGWTSSHDLDPYKPLVSPVPPLEVRVVSLDWKWLFIYPAQGVASVNRLVIPAGVPVHFTLTSASVMNSFFVPQLGGQIYTMAGMATQLSLEADRPGTYPGLSAQFSGDGFADMRFIVRAVPGGDFAAWVAATKAHAPALDGPAYAALARTSLNDPPADYGRVDPGLFDRIIQADRPPYKSGKAGPGPAGRAQ
jgi:cytochrome o ubiquinol oxidase subunit 2